MTLYTRRKNNSDDSLIPMINVVFLLLLFFMIAGQIQARSGDAIALPQSSSEAPAIPRHHRLEINAEGTLTLDGIGTQPAQLSTLLTGSEPDTTVALVADKHITATQLNAVIQALRKAGIATISLRVTGGGE